MEKNKRPDIIVVTMTDGWDRRSVDALSLVLVNPQSGLNTKL